VLGVLTCAYLAAAFLTAEARRDGSADLEQWSRRRAVAAAVAAGAVALAGVAVLDHDAHRLYLRLLHVGWPAVALSLLCGVAALGVIAAPRLRGYPHLARALGIAAVGAVLAGWGVAQYPYLLGTHLRIGAAAAPTQTLDALATVTVVALILVGPSLAWLFTLTEHGRLVDPPAA
jgi:cytochrome d ubiquinol oxidase subunit II